MDSKGRWRRDEVYGGKVLGFWLVYKGIRNIRSALCTYFEAVYIISGSLKTLFDFPVEGQVKNELPSREYD